MKLGVWLCSAAVLVGIDAQAGEPASWYETEVIPEGMTTDVKDLECVTDTYGETLTIDNPFEEAWPDLDVLDDAIDRRPDRSTHCETYCFPLLGCVHCCVITEDGRTIDSHCSLSAVLQE